MSPPALPTAIECGWLSLHDLQGCEQLDEPRWIADKKLWIFSVRLRSDDSSDLVPEHTQWIVTVDSIYPEGDVEVYPARDDGLTNTFQHQSPNAPPARGDLWRAGKLCLTAPWSEYRHRDRARPPTTPEQRLRWTLERAREWLRRAATRTLASAGDPFELPDFGANTHSELGIVVAPGVMSAGDWLQHSAPMWGKAAWRTLQPGPATDRITVLRELQYQGTPALPLQPWGEMLSDTTGTDRHGAWLWLPSPPILRPWQAPRTWGELHAWARHHGIDIEQPLTDLCMSFRGQAGALVLVGFPIPARFADSFSQVAWQALRMPALRSRAQRPHRDRRMDLATLDRHGPLADTQPLDWLTTQTWSRDRLSVRGVVAPSLQDLRVALIGVGAVGARLAELLVRGGVRQLHLIDGDHVQAGNLVRHTASLRALGVKKADVVGHELQAASPFAQLTASNMGLPADPHDAAALLGTADIVIDATASDAVLRTLSALPGDHSRRWMSVSLNRHAERIYCHLAYAPRFPLADFQQALRPWSEDDGARHLAPLPWEGAGCWSPVFPARIDDITALVALAVRELERLVVRPPTAPELRVYERDCDEEGTLRAIRRSDKPGPRSPIRGE